MTNQAIFPEQLKQKAERVHYAKRLETRIVKESDFPYHAEQPMSSPAAVAQFARTLQDSDVEKLLVLYLNTKNFLNCIQVMRGTIDRTVIYPREIIKHAILSNAASLVLVHNHPSGYPQGHGGQGHHQRVQDENEPKELLQQTA